MMAVEILATLVLCALFGVALQSMFLVLVGLFYFLFMMLVIVPLIYLVVKPLEWLWRQVEKRPALERWLRLIFTSERTPWQQFVYAVRWPFKRVRQ